MTLTTNAHHSIWVEKYRPDSLDGYIGNEAMKEKFARYIQSGEVPHLLFVGRAGTGKTTAAKILVKHIACDLLFLNASDDNNIETVRGKIRGFASTMGMENIKIVVLDEFDGFTRQGQEALRNLMERYSENTRFILTANYLERVIEPILSRVQTIHVVPPSKKDVCLHLVKILKAEDVTYNATDVKTLVESYFPDVRKVINEAQLHVTDGALVMDSAAVVANDTKTKLVELLTQRDKNTFVNIRQLLADARVRDYTDFYRALYDHLEQYASPVKMPEVILSLAEGQYRDSLVIDKEVNMMGTVINILTILG